MCKGPEAGVCLAHLRNSRDAGESGTDDQEREEQELKSSV